MLSKGIYKIIYRKYNGAYFDNTKTSKALGYYEKNYYCEKFWHAAHESSFYRCCEIVKEYISRKGYLTNQIFIQELCRCCCEMDVRDKSALYEKLLERKETKGLYFVKREDWEKVLYLVLSQKMFRLAEFIRNKFVNQLKDRGYFRDLFCLLVEEGKYEEALDRLERSKMYRFKKAFLKRSLVSYWNALPIYKPEGNKGPYYDKRFAELIENKDVVIIGPSSNGEEYTIDNSKSVIVRFAYFGSSDKKNITDMSYYNGLHSVKMEENQAVPEGISQCVFKYMRSTTFRWYIYDKELGRMARWSLKIMLPGCSPNMLQVALADLLHYAKRVRVFDSNLYINNVYCSGYASNELLKTMSNYKKDSMFAQHDIIGNFIYTKSLFDNGYFEADKKLSGILNMSVKEYAYQMELNNGFLEVNV